MDSRQATAEQLNILHRLETVVASTSAFLKRHGIQKSSQISPANRAIFLSKPREQLLLTTENAERALAVHLEAEDDSMFDFDDTHHLLSIALKELRLGVDPEFYKLMDRSDIVEVYNSDNIQIFRSFNFFKICSYNLDDILSHEWFELYDRDPSITAQVMDTYMAHLNGTTSMTKFMLPEHLMAERLSETPGTFATQFKYLASVFSGPQRIPGAVITMSAKVVRAASNIELKRRETIFSVDPNISQ